MIYSCIRTTLVVGGVGDERVEGEKCESLPVCQKKNAGIYDLPY